MTRREWLIAVAAAAAGCNSERPQRGFLGVMDRWNLRVQSALFRPSRRARELGPGAETPAGEFPEYFVSSSVPIAPAGWALRTGGLVARPMVLRLEDLQRMPRTEVRVRHHCVEGWSAVASWHGVQMSQLAERVGASPRARFVEFRSFDVDYSSSWDRESAEHSQTILAYGMNGRPLAPGNGAPLRLYAGVKLGYKMVKYLTEVNFLDHPTGGYWEDRGYEWYAGV